MGCRADNTRIATLSSSVSPKAASASRAATRASAANFFHGPGEAASRGDKSKCKAYRSPNRRKDLLVDVSGRYRWGTDPGCACRQRRPLTAVPLLPSPVIPSKKWEATKEGQLLEVRDLIISSDARPIFNLFLHLQLSQQNFPISSTLSISSIIFPFSSYANSS